MPPAEGDRRPTKKQKKGQPRRQPNWASSLAWKPVPLPLEAVATGGQSDADFFQGLDFDDDDYMGIKEVEGVKVVKGKDGSVKLVTEDSNKKEAESKKKRKATEQAELVSSNEDQESEDLEASFLEESDVQTDAGDETPSEIPSEEEQDVDAEDDSDDPSMGDQNDSISELGVEEKTKEEHEVDFTLLAEDKIDGQEKHKWSKKAYAQKLPGWSKLQLKLQDKLKTSLLSLTFKQPTPIQALSLPQAMQSSDVRRDVVGVAQTGSGKTLAYGLPILQWICENSIEDRQMRLMEESSENEEGTRLAGLILAPTRELALQVTQHLEAIIAASSDEKNKWASVATLTGGISEEKQRRLLNGFQGRGVDIIVATPGRLWDMCKGDDALTKRIKLTRFLVVDEADRMVEMGHFAEMESILALVKRFESQEASGLPSSSRVAGGAKDMQTFVFSATLSKDLQHNLKRAKRKRKAKGGSTMDELINLIDFRDEDPVVIDLSTKTRVASKLVESRLECLNKEKDLYLYYFLLRYPGRTLVFLNAIDGVRRLQPLLENLRFSVQPLHSQLQQKQRLKNLERFKSSRAPSIQGNSILLATDVAARGLDIPAVDHVVHFQLPRTADTYVHRCGRTARAGQSGISLALVEPAEKRLWRDLSRSLRRSDDVPSLPIEYSFLTPLKERITLARELDKVSHAEKKASHDDAWLRKMAEEADMELSDVENDIDAPKRQKGSKATQSIRAKLAQTLDRPLSARGVSFKYITSGSQDFVQSLLSDQQHGSMIGVLKTRAEDDVVEERKLVVTKAGKGKKIESR